MILLQALEITVLLVLALEITVLLVLALEITVLLQALENGCQREQANFHVWGKALLRHRG